MATYEYSCPKCETTEIVERRMSDSEPSTGYTCGDCGGRLHRVFISAPVKFNGGGFYSTGG